MQEPLADAMLFEPIPYRAALAEGATHVLVLRTRPDGVNLVRKQASTYGCSLCHIRLQFVTRTVAASGTYGCSL